MKKLQQVFSTRFILMNVVIPLVWLLVLHFANLKFFNSKMLPVVTLLFTLIGSNLNSLAIRLSSEMNYTRSFITISKKTYLDLFWEEIKIFILYNILFITIYTILYCLINDKWNDVLLTLKILVIPGMIFSLIIATISVTLALVIKPQILDKVITIFYFTSIYFLVFIKELINIPNVPNFIREIQKIMPSTYWLNYINHQDIKSIIYLIVEFVFVLFFSVTILKIKK